MRVVSHHPWRQALMVLAVVVVCAGGALGAYQLGRATAELDDTYHGSVERLNQANQATIERLEAELIEAQRRAAAEKEKLAVQHAEASAMPAAGQAEQQQGQPAPAQPFTRQQPKVGRNDPCPCGSGKKYKQCHGKL